MSFKLCSFFLFISLLSASLVLSCPDVSCAKSQTRHHQTVRKDKRSHRALVKDRLSQADRKALRAASKSYQPASRLDSNHDLWLERARKNSSVTLGVASWYGKDWHMRKTASGLPYDMYTFTAAHRTLPLGTVVRVTDRFNGRSVMVSVTDRGPYAKGRIIDLSYAAASRLNLETRGIANVGLEVVSDTAGRPLSSDQAFFVQFRSLSGADRLGPYTTFADAAAMHEAVLSAHPEAQVILDKANR